MYYLFAVIVCALIFCGADCENTKAIYPGQPASLHQYIAFPFDTIGQTDDQAFIVRDIIAVDFNQNAYALEIIANDKTLITIAFIDGIAEISMYDGIRIPPNSEINSLTWVSDGGTIFVQTTLEGYLEN